eukprot:g20102.t1
MIPVYVVKFLGINPVEWMDEDGREAVPPEPYRGRTPISPREFYVDVPAQYLRFKVGLRWNRLGNMENDGTRTPTVDWEQANPFELVESTSAVAEREEEVCEKQQSGKYRAEHLDNEGAEEDDAEGENAVDTDAEEFFSAEEDEEGAVEEDAEEEVDMRPRPSTGLVDLEEEDDEVEEGANEEVTEVEDAEK